MPCSSRRMNLPWPCVWTRISRTTTSASPLLRQLMTMSFPPAPTMKRWTRPEGTYGSSNSRIGSAAGGSGTKSCHRTHGICWAGGAVVRDDVAHRGAKESGMRSWRTARKDNALTQSVGNRRAARRDGRAGGGQNCSRGARYDHTQGNEARVTSQCYLHSKSGRHGTERRGEGLIQASSRLRFLPRRLKMKLLPPGGMVKSR